MDQSPIDFLKLDSSSDWTLPFSRDDWEKTPPTVRLYIAALHRKLTEQLKMTEAISKRVEELESRLNRNSSNSNQPPSSDSPFQKKQHKTLTGKPGGKKGHKGHRQVMLEPLEVKPLKPEVCSCGNHDFPETMPFYTHRERRITRLDRIAQAKLECKPGQVGLIRIDRPPEADSG